MSAYLVGYARVPFTKFTGQLAAQPASVLGAHAVAAALKQAGVSPETVDQVVFGQVLQAGAGQNPARQTAVGAGIPLTTPAMTLNVVCLSGMEAVAAAVRLINTGEADVVVAGGQESMSRAPHLLNLRSGHKYGSAHLLDSVEHDGLTDAFEQRSMGISTETGNSDLGLGREEQDQYAASSHQRAPAAADYLAGEITPFIVSSRRGDTTVSEDDGVRPDTTTDTLANLRPAFTKEGTITAGNASQITDGAAALVVVSEAFLARQGTQAIARIESHAFVAGPDVQLHAQPANAIKRALDKIDASASELAAVEINEAFASIVLHSVNELGIDLKIVNTRGGAIALGHPIGASGARIVGTLARQLAEGGSGQLGAAGICGGGGQGSAMMLRSM